MNYKYRRGQLFGKRLNAPRSVREDVYNCNLSLEDYIKYDLDGKVPVACITAEDRKILEKFGVEKCSSLDWELINSKHDEVDIRSVLLSLDSSVDDLNEELYSIVKDKIRPIDYSSRMKMVFADRLIDIPSSELNMGEILCVRDFNNGSCTLEKMVKYFHLFKDKDISLCLANDKRNTYGLTSDDVKEFVSKFGFLIPYIGYVIEKNSVYELIGDYKNKESDYDKDVYITRLANRVLSTILYDNSDKSVTLSNDEFGDLFIYANYDTFLSFVSRRAPNLARELKVLPIDYLLDSTIPFSVLLDREVMAFLNEFGVENVMEFDRKCGGFFSKDDCYMLKMMNKLYLNYSYDIYDNTLNINVPKTNAYSNGGHFLYNYYTKDGFYEAMRRIIIYGPTDIEYEGTRPDYRHISGLFRKKFPELFLSDDAFEELKDLFYSKLLTPRIIFEHPEYIPFLEGKELSAGFKNLDIEVKEKRHGMNYRNLYSYLNEKFEFNDVIRFISEYCDVLEIAFGFEYSDYMYNCDYLVSDSLEDIENKICDSLRLILIEKGVSYPENIPSKFKEKFPNLFLSDDAPEELKFAFYNRSLDIDFIWSNPLYIHYLKGVELEVLFKCMNVKVNTGSYPKTVNIINVIKDTFGDEAFDVMLLYGQYLDKICENGYIKNLVFERNCSKDECLDTMDKIIYENIISGKIKYDEKLPSHFKNNYPMLFLDSNVSQEIKYKFYNRELSISDFVEKPELVEVFGSTNVVCGFSDELAWMIPLFSDDENQNIANYNRIKVISAYLKLEDVSLQKAFKEFVLTSGGDIDIDKIEYASEVLNRLSLSNSSEVFNFRKELAIQILKADDPLECLSKIEDIFVRSHIPTVGKVYACFDVLHPDFAGINFDNKKVSPMLKESSVRSKKVLVFSDLIKASFGSNNRSVISYLDNIEIGSKLYDDIRDGKVKFDDLSLEEKSELATFTKHLATLYNNTYEAKRVDDVFVCGDDVVSDLFALSKKLSTNGSLDYNLGDRVIRMFCGFVGISTLSDARKYIEEKTIKADSRNRDAACFDMKLEIGDFVKGIRDISYLGSILQNGSVAKEFLGSSAKSDRTPLDTDLSCILSDEGSVSATLKNTAAGGYGPIWFVLKRDDRFITTRTHDGVKEDKKDRDKLEVFHTGALGEGHYGIRTGFASSEINYIIVEKYDPRVGLEIAMNGFYIPVADMNGKIVFTPEDFDLLRSKMSGLSYYGENSYQFSSNLVNDDVLSLASQIDENNQAIKEKRDKLNEVIEKSLEELGLKLKTEIDGDLTEGYVELIDTGSTGRGTNKPGDGDFDMIMRLDRTVLSNPEKVELLKKTLLKNLGKEDSDGVIKSGDFRLKNVLLDGVSIDLDITFTEKTDKVSYSTDMALQDRLDTIKKNDPLKYRMVVGNILLAKQVLKEAGVYKPDRGLNPEGGLGGVGVENWILQNGGSFIDAARSYVEASKGKTFEEFKSSYFVWDFGSNHLAERRNSYAHGNFVSDNMSEDGHHRMVDALTQYLNKYDNNKTTGNGKKTNV